MVCPSMLGDHSTRLAPAIRDMIPLAEDGTSGYGLGVCPRNNVLNDMRH